MSTNAVQEVADRLAIEQVLARYCRGIDRCDAAELKQVFSEDALIDYGDGAKPRDETVDGLMVGLGGMLLTHHNIGNVICAIDGDSAKVETYCVAYHWLPGDPEIEMVVGGRYLDHLTKREGQWQIVDRRYVMDWNRQAPSGMQVSGGMYDTLQRRGARKPDDPSYAFWNSSVG